MSKISSSEDLCGSTRLGAFPKYASLRRGLMWLIVASVKLFLHFFKGKGFRKKIPFPVGFRKESCMYQHVPATG
jgi:hypothetical protein